MTGRQLFQSLQYLDDALVEASDPRPANKTVWIRLGAAAAAFVLIVGAVLVLPRLRHGGELQPGGVSGGEVNWTELPQSAAGEPQPVGVPGPDALLPEAAKPTVLAWNELDAPRGGLEADVAGVVMVSEPLTAAQIAACAPEIREAWMETFTGFALYYLAKGEGGLAYLEMTVANDGWGGVSTVRIRDKNAPEPATCYVVPRETDKVGSLGGQEYRAYRCSYRGAGDPQEAWTELTVIFEKENAEYTLRANVPQAHSELAAADLRDLLLCYAGTHASPDLSKFQYGEYLLRDESLTPDEALADPDFGAYFPAEGPDGFELTDVRRYQFEEITNYLHGFWSCGYGYLDWLIQPMTEDAQGRVVTAAERERYDLSLYPVPWSDSVPQEHRETVSDPVFRIGELTMDLVKARVQSGDEGMPRCFFSVLFDGGILVRVSAKGLSAEWIFNSLTRIGGSD